MRGYHSYDLWREKSDRSGLVLRKLRFRSRRFLSRFQFLVTGMDNHDAIHPHFDVLVGDGSACAVSHKNSRCVQFVLGSGVRPGNRIWELIDRTKTCRRMRRIMHLRSIVTLCLFGTASVVALKFPLVKLGICICCLIV